MKFRSSMIAGMSARALLLTVSPAALAQQSPGLNEMRTAEEHAGLAAAAGQLPEVRNQLQQALNCLVGRRGDDYRASAGDPCKGAGALQNLPPNSVNRIRVGKAIRLASVGVTFHDFEPAHYTAQAVQAVLAEGTR